MQAFEGDSQLVILAQALCFEEPRPYLFLPRTPLSHDRLKPSFIHESKEILLFCWQILCQSEEKDHSLRTASFLILSSEFSIKFGLHLHHLIHQTVTFYLCGVGHNTVWFLDCPGSIINLDDLPYSGLVETYTDFHLFCFLTTSNFIFSTNGSVWNSVLLAPSSRHATEIAPPNVIPIQGACPHKR